MLTLLSDAGWSHLENIVVVLVIGFVAAVFFGFGRRRG